MVSKWAPPYPEYLVGSWRISVPRQSETLSESNIETSELLAQACEALRDYFLPNHVSVHWFERERDFRRDEVHKPVDMEVISETKIEKFPAKAGYQPQEISKLIQNLAESDKAQRTIHEVHINGIQKILDVNDRGDFVEVWESRPDDIQSGTLEFDCYNLFPLETRCYLETRSRIFLKTLRSDEGVIDNTEIAEKNRARLPEVLKKLEKALGGRIVGWYSEVLESPDRDPLWRYGFR